MALEYIKYIRTNFRDKDKDKNVFRQHAQLADVVICWRILVNLFTISSYSCS